MSLDIIVNTEAKLQKAYCAVNIVIFTYRDILQLIN